MPIVWKVCTVNCWLMELELTHFDEGDQRAMPEKLEVTASAPAYSDQRSAGTNSSSMVILTKERSGEQQRAARGEEERHLNSLSPFVISAW